jgi:hypothetical protein
MIVFITKNIDSFNNPTIDAFLTILEERKQNSIIICPKNIYENRFKCCRVILYKDEIINRADGLKVLFLKLHQKVCQFFNIVFIKYRITTIIAIDPRGLIFSSWLKRKFFITAPLDYLSFEIFEGIIYKDKSREIEASQHIRNLIIQDTLREEFIRVENKLIKHVKIFYIPVCPIFKNNYEHDIEDFRLIHSISSEKKLIINFGTFDIWSGADFIYNLLINCFLPDDYVFVIHSRFPLNPNIPIHKKIIDYTLNNNNLVLSNIYINSFDDSILFLKQFDLATAFYIPDNGLYTGKNIYNIGLSSGKFSMYMKAGLPTFTVDLPTYQELNSKYNFGFTVKSPQEFSEKLKLNFNKNEYELNCFRLYKELLEPRKIIQNYFDEIKCLNSPSSPSTTTPSKGFNQLWRVLSIKLCKSLSIFHL